MAKKKSEPKNAKPEVKTEKPDVEKTPKTQKTEKVKKPKKPFILFRPFIALGRYLRDSWRELRQVRWPNRKATWKMVIAVLVYSAIFFVLIMLLDSLFELISSNVFTN